MFLRILALPFFMLSLAAAQPKTIIVKTPKMPLVATTLYFPFGSGSEIIGERGNTKVVFDWLEDATESKSAQQIRRGFLAAGAKYSVAVDQVYTTVSLEAPVEYYDGAWNLLLEVLRKPAFTKDSLELVVQKQISNKRARLSNVLGISKNIMSGALYAGTPYGASPYGVDEDLKSLTIKSAKAYYQKTIHHGPSALFISDSMPKKLVNSIKGSLKDWNANAPKATTKVSPVEGKLAIIVDRPGSTQVYFSIGKVAPKANHKDRFPLMWSTELLGGNGAGGGDNLLFKELRSKRALTYHASMQVWQRFDRDAIIGLTFGANSKIKELVAGYMQIWNDFNKPKAAELNKISEARMRVNASRQRGMATVAESMATAAELWSVGLTSTPIIPKASITAFNESRKKWLQQSDYLAIIYGDAKKIEQPLQEVLGKDTKFTVVGSKSDWEQINSAVLALTALKKPS